MFELALDNFPDTSARMQAITSSLPRRMAGNANGEAVAEDPPALLPMEEGEKEEEEGRPFRALPETTSTRQTWTVPYIGVGRKRRRGSRIDKTKGAT